MTIWAQDVILTGLPPAWGHVLKLEVGLFHDRDLSVAPRVGACIETSCNLRKQKVPRVAPRVGACIETAYVSRTRY